MVYKFGLEFKYGLNSSKLCVLQSVQLLEHFLSIKLASVAYDSSCAVCRALLKEICLKLSFLQVDDERVAEELFREQAGSSASQKTVYQLV
jgi:hypothetical protein